MGIGVFFTVLHASHAWVNSDTLCERHTEGEELPNHLTMILEIIIFPNYAFFLMPCELVIVLTAQGTDTVKPNCHEWIIQKTTKIKKMLKCTN